MRGLYHPPIAQAITERDKSPKSCVTLVCTVPAAGVERSTLLLPLGLLLSGQPFSATFDLVLALAASLIAVHMKREDRGHREAVAAIRQHGPPSG